MNKPNFEMAQNAATNFLLHHEINGLSFDPHNLDLSSEDILIDTIQNYAKLTNCSVSCFIGRNIDGCYVVKRDDVCLILYDENDTDFEARKNFGIAHELGHIYCGHTTDGKKQEIEANFFAAQVLMPEIVVYYIMYKYKDFKLDARDLMEIFNVSYEAANKRLTTFVNKKFMNRAANDKLLLTKFIPFIEEYYKESTHNNNEHKRLLAI